MAKALARHDQILRVAIEGNGGYVFSTAGDAFAAAFPTAASAIAAACTAQADLAAEPWGVAEINVRMGLNTGVAEERDGDYFGPVLNRAARIMGLANGAQILLSHTTTELVRDPLDPTYELHDVGERNLKSHRRPEHLHQLMGPGLSSELIGAASALQLGNLPAGVSEFVGRDNDIAEVRSQIAVGTVVTLTGIGGAGKTQLATRTAATLVGDHPDGVWWCDLSSLGSPELIPSAIASMLGFVLQPDLSPIGSVVDAIASRQLLLVLDNCEHLLDGVATLLEAVLPGCPDVAVLATSRESIGVANERVWPLRPLDSSTDAVELLIRRAVAADASVDPDTWDRRDLVELCERLDGIPLAIEMAAPRLRSLGPREVIDRLDDRFRLLRSRRRDVGGRHQTLLATLDWSYGLLSPDERLLLDRLSIFASVFDLATAEAVCADEALDDFDLVELLDSLVDKSLVTLVRAGTRMRFRLLETVRQYGRSHLTEREETTGLRRRHATVYAELAELADHRFITKEFWSGLAAFGDNWADILAAIEWAVTADDSELAQRLLSSCGNYTTALGAAEIGELARPALEMTKPPTGAFWLAAFFADGPEQITHTLAGLEGADLSAADRMGLNSQLAAGRATTGAHGTLAAVGAALEAAHESEIPVHVAYWEAIIAEATVSRAPETAASHAATAREALEGWLEHPMASAALGRLASYEALSGRLDVAADLCDTVTALADDAGLIVFGAYTVALSARIAAVLDPDGAALLLSNAIMSARETRWWFNVWPALSGAGRWFETRNRPKAAAAVDGFFEARGKPRAHYDLALNTDADLAREVEYRRLGASMSPDELVDFVLDEIAIASGSASTGPEWA